MLKKLVDSWKWHGSWFPQQQCFDELMSQVPMHEHDELKRLIEVRAQEYDATLE